MVEHLTQKQVEDYCRQQLSVAELLSVSDHLGECEACRGRVESAMSCDAALFAMRAEVFSEAAGISSTQAARAHLTEEQTASYVDRKLSGEELQIVSDHLSSCGQCALAVDDLDAFRNEVAPSLEREYHPATVPSKAEGWWQRTFASLPAFFQVSARPAFGAAMAVLLLALTGWFIWWTLRDREPKQEIVALPAPTSQPTPEPQPAPHVATRECARGRATQ